MAPSAIPHRPTDPPHHVPRSPQLPQRPLRRLSPSDRRALNQQNHWWLVAYASSGDETTRLHWRNRLVEANLGLVHSVAARFIGISQLPCCDLVQVGCQGLIRAVEAFDGRRTRCLSTFAVPYVRGAIQHELRDRESWIRPPRKLWELRHRARALQDERRAAGLPPLAQEGLAAALGCTASEVDEAEGLRQVGHPLSLDALQCSNADADGESTTWLDHLADPRSLPEEAPPPLDVRRRAQVAWLQGQLAQMDALQRQLLIARLVMGCTWVEVGRQHGLHPRMAERRCSAALRQLQASGEVWLQDGGSGPPSSELLVPAGLRTHQQRWRRVG
ncbi:MAG: sigma-70 family RNA polymerase sigma factor [Cyanobacteriota bacterium]